MQNWRHLLYPTTTFGHYEVLMWLSWESTVKTVNMTCLILKPESLDITFILCTDSSLEILHKQKPRTLKMPWKILIGFINTWWITININIYITSTEFFFFFFKSAFKMSSLHTQTKVHGGEHNKHKQHSPCSELYQTLRGVSWQVKYLHWFCSYQLHLSKCQGYLTSQLDKMQNTSISKCEMHTDRLQQSQPSHIKKHHLIHPDPCSFPFSSSWRKGSLVNISICQVMLSQF